MIVVIGSPVGRTVDGIVVAGGMVSRVALAAARSGRAVQLVGKTGDDPTADGVVLDLARGGVGHVALLRESVRTTPIELTPADADDERLEPVDPDAPDRPGSPGSAPVIEPPALDAADVDLGLRYLTDYRVVVVAEPVGPDIVAIAADAARWAEARLLLVIAPGGAVPDGLPADVVVFEAPPEDPDGVFADVVGAFAASLDEGIEPAAAFQRSIATDGWTGAAAD